jgi:hypothetical protein
MKTTMAKQGAYTGAGAGLVLFGLFGLMPGSLLGGAVGVNIAGMLFGLPLEPGMLSRLIVLVSMFAGVLVTGTAVVTATASLGWLIGNTMSNLTEINILASAERR